MVERTDARPQNFYVAARRARRRRPVRQPLLPRAIAHPTVDPRTPLGDLQRLCRALKSSAGVVRLATPHRGHPTHSRYLRGPRMGKAARPQFARNALGLSSAGLDRRNPPAAGGKAGLRGLDSGIEARARWSRNFV